MRSRRIFDQMTRTRSGFYSGNGGNSERSSSTLVYLGKKLEPYGSSPVVRDFLEAAG